MTSYLDDDEKARVEANIAWLQNADPDDWHRVALDFNWSEPLEVLEWIVRQPDCDMATALTIFWKGQPGAFLEEAEADDDGDLNKSICAFIANRVKAGGYTRSEICFTPDTWTKKDYVDLVAVEEKLIEPNFRTHPDLIRNRGGREVGSSYEFSLRYPEAFHHGSYIPPSDFDGIAEQDEPDDLMTKVKQVERATYEALPEWLQKQPVANLASSEAGANDDASHRVRALRRGATPLTLTGYDRDFFTQSPDESLPPTPKPKGAQLMPEAAGLRADVAILIGNLMILGSAVLYLKVHAEIRSLTGFAVLGIVVLIVHMTYSLYSGYRDLKVRENAGQIDLSDRWFKVGANGCFVFGAVIAWPLGGYFSALMQSLYASYGLVTAAIGGLLLVLPVFALGAWLLAPLLMRRFIIK